MALTESLACGLQKCIGNFCIGDDFSDFTVVVEGTHFRCHRVILSACSGFFLGLLRSQMKECQQGVVKLDTMAKSTFEIVLNSIYKGIDGLSEDTVLDVWSATELLQIDYMIEECKKFVTDKITVDNCLAYLNHATIYSAQNTIDHAMNFIIKHFKKVRGAETFLQLPFDYLYKVIESDSLETDSEDMVVETILAWVNYIPCSEPCLWLFTGTLDAERRIETLSLVIDSTTCLSKRASEEKANDGDQETRHQLQVKGNNEQAKINDNPETNNRQEKGDDDQSEENNDEAKIHSGGRTRNDNRTQVHDFQNGVTEDQGNVNSDQAMRKDAQPKTKTDTVNRHSTEGDVLLKNTHDSNVSESSENTMTSMSNTDMPVNDNNFCNTTGNTQTDCEDRGRQKYFKKLISACRYFLVKPTFLQNLMKNHIDLLTRTRTYNLVLKALMYTSSVEHHPDSWPDAAVYRSTSSNKHVMVFVSNDKFMAYSLNTGSSHQFVSLPQDFRKDLHTVNIIVSGNVLYLQYEDEKVRILSMLTKQKTWLSMNRSLPYDSKMLVAQGNCIYELWNKIGETTNYLRRCSRAYGNTKEWSHCCNLEITGNSLIEFQEYIVIFGTEDNVVTAHCYNTETGKIHTCKTSMGGTSEDMVSFRRRKDVYIIQRNGTLWKVFSTDKSPVDFELVSKLWDFDCSLKGCVLYRNKLFIFCDDIQQMDSSTPLTSLPGIFENIQMVKIDSRTECLPMIVPKTWFTS